MRLHRLINRAIKQFKNFVSIGPESLVDDLLNGIRVWSLGGGTKKNIYAEGSISGMDSGYLRLVEEALSKENVFRKFKSSREYREILEHVNRELGEEYLQVIQSYKNVPHSLMEFCKTDYCKPFRYSYHNIGRVAPSNLRYAKIALDIRLLFGNLDGFSMAEIGIGYGGQLHALSALSTPSNYTFYDLPPVVQLANKYCSRFNLKSTHLTSGDINESKSNFDLVISNYAFSELNRSLQEKYLENVILKSKRGYLIYNDLSYGKFDTIKVNDFANLISGAEIIQEFPTTHSQNKLVIWGHQDASGIFLGK